MIINRRIFYPKLMYVVHTRNQPYHSYYYYYPTCIRRENQRLDISHIITIIIIRRISVRESEARFQPHYCYFSISGLVGLIPESALVGKMYDT